jgi:hypothetical protein
VQIYNEGCSQCQLRGAWWEKQKSQAEVAAMQQRNNAVILQYINIYFCTPGQRGKNLAPLLGVY